MNKKSLFIQLVCLVIGLFFATIAFTQDVETEKKNWLLGVIFKLEKITLTPLHTFSIPNKVLPPS
ncbi:unnamed protein product [marine sediment metagenome]|uniref:Uncharacterized protein n=1 Tax=marine sediment metagenome TaxID=412755 RepID=X1LNT7_9ZZZZ